MTKRKPVLIGDQTEHGFRQYEVTNHGPGTILVTMWNVVDRVEVAAGQSVIGPINSIFHGTARARYFVEDVEVITDGESSKGSGNA